METLRLELTGNQAMALAQLVKRIKLPDLHAKAVNDEEAHTMQQAMEVVGRGLAELGYNPNELLND